MRTWSACESVVIGQILDAASAATAAGDEVVVIEVETKPALDPGSDPVPVFLVMDVRVVARLVAVVEALAGL